MHQDAGTANSQTKRTASGDSNIVHKNCFVCLFSLYGSLRASLVSNPLILRIGGSYLRDTKESFLFALLDLVPLDALELFNEYDRRAVFACVEITRNGRQEGSFLRYPT